jgi:hypothetical protein
MYMRSHPLSILIFRSGRRGFALPLTLIIGLAMMSMGAVMLARSRSDTSRAVAQKNTMVGMGVTEAGIAQYQQLMQKNENLAYYPTCINDPETPNGTACDAQSWKNVASLPEIQACETGDLNTIEAKASTGWQAVDPSDPKKGQYRLAGYTYKYFPDPTNRDPGTLVAGVGTAPGQGTLVIDGRAADNLDPSNSSARDAVSTSRVEVTIPVEPRQLTGSVPGVWLTEGGTGGNNRVQGDVLINDCGVNLTDVRVTGSDPTTGEAYGARYTTMQFPDLPTMPTLTGTPRAHHILGVLSGEDYTFPRTGDIPIDVTRTVNGTTVTEKVYEYIVDSIDLQSGNKTIIVDADRLLPAGTRARVVFYLKGSINKGGEILHACPTTPGSTCKPTDFQIYGYGTLNGPSASYEMCLIGNNQLEAFILAPNYSVGIAGTGVIEGSIWAKQWSNGSGCGAMSSQIVVEQTARWQDLGLTPENIPPTIKPATDWKQKEVQP